MMRFAFLALATLLALFASSAQAVVPPTIVCGPANIDVEALSFACAAQLEPVPPTVTGPGEYTVTQTSGFAPGAPYPVGCTDVEFAVYDDPTGDLLGGCLTVVCVTDTTPPTIVCPPDQFWIIPSGQSTVVVEFSPAVGYDNCCDTCLTQTGGVISGAALGLGVYENVWQIVDDAGLMTTCTQTITVVAEV